MEKATVTKIVKNLGLGLGLGYQEPVARGDKP